MSHRHVTLTVLALAVGVTSCLTGFPACGQSTNSSDTTTAPAARALSAASRNTALRRDGLRQLEADLSGAFQGVFAHSKMGGTDQRPVRVIVVPAAQPPKSGNPLDSAKDWAFSTPDDLNGKNQMKEMLSSTEPNASSEAGQSRKPTAMERYYQSLQRPLGGPSKGGLQPLSGSSANGSSLTGDSADKGQDSSMSGEMKDTAENLRKLVDSNSDSPLSADYKRQSLMDVFGTDAGNYVNGNPAFGNNALEQYHQFLQNQSSASSSLSSLGTTRSAAAHMGGLDSYLGGNSAVKSGFDVQSGAASSTHLPTVEDVNAKALNSWNPMYQAPKSAPAPAVKPPPANLQAPRRPF